MKSYQGSYPLQGNNETRRCVVVSTFPNGKVLFTQGDTTQACERILRSQCRNTRNNFDEADSLLFRDLDVFGLERLLMYLTIRKKTFDSCDLTEAELEAAMKTKAH